MRFPVTGQQGHGYRIIQFYGRSRLPYPCSPMLHKQNTCGLAAVFCNRCRNSLPCKQALRVTNIYVLSCDVLLSVVIFCPNSEQFFYFIICCLPYCCVTVIFYCTAIRATVRELLGREAVVAGIAVIVVHLISPRYSSWSLSENHCGVQEELVADILLPRGCSA